MINSSERGAVQQEERWTHVLPASVRSSGRTLLHAWQHIHDVVLGTLRLYPKGELQWQVRNKLLRRAVPIVEDDHGFRFAIYPSDQTRILDLAMHTADTAEFAALPRLISRGAIALDIGANIGSYSVLLSRLCGPSGRVWAFEPVLDSYWRLRETMALNRCENVIPVRAAICETDGTITINLFPPEHSEWNSLGKPLMRDRAGNRVSPDQSAEVPAMTLDRFCEKEGLTHIDFLKVDVEGFEIPVFGGGKRVLSENRVDYVCFEISRDPLGGAGFDSCDVFRTLEAYGYSCYRLDKASGQFVGPIHDTQEQWANFFACRKGLSLS